MPPAPLQGVVHSTQGFTLGTLKMFPGTCSRRSSKPFGFPSKRHSATRHCRPRPSAAVEVLLVSSFSIAVYDHRKRNSLSDPAPSSRGLLRFEARGEERPRAVEREMQLPSQRGAKPAQARNEMNGRGPPPAGRMPFMSDSTLSRRSAALCRRNPPDQVTHRE